MAQNNKEYEPQIIRAGDDADFAARAAQFFVDALRGTENPLVILPTGNTPLGLYRYLRENTKDETFWNGFRYLALDEYLGLEENDERSFAGWVGRELLDHIGVPADRRITFKDTDDACAQMEDYIATHGPIDLAVVGLGGNGHIGFNEPGSTFDSRAHTVDLTPETIAANASYWGGADKVPHRACTLGLATLATAKQTLVLVSGAHKADILQKALTAPLSPDIPATYLRTVPNVTIIADEAALS